VDRSLVTHGNQDGNTQQYPPGPPPETIENRIRVYEDQTSPVMGYYDGQGKYRGVNGVGGIEDIFERLTGIIANL